MAEAAIPVLPLRAKMTSTMESPACFVEKQLDYCSELEWLRLAPIAKVTCRITINCACSTVHPADDGGHDLWLDEWSTKEPHGLMTECLIDVLWVLGCVG